MQFRVFPPIKSCVGDGAPRNSAHKCGNVRFFMHFLDPARINATAHFKQIIVHFRDRNFSHKVIGPAGAFVVVFDWVAIADYLAHIAAKITIAVEKLFPRCNVPTLFQRSFSSTKFKSENTALGGVRGVELNGLVNVPSVKHAVQCVLPMALGNCSICLESVIAAR